MNYESITSKAKRRFLSIINHRLPSPTLAITPALVFCGGVFMNARLKSKGYISFVVSFGHLLGLL